VGAQRIATAGAEIAAEVRGSGPAIVLLHGFPETRLMWRDIAPVLAESCTVVTADLRGYGESSAPGGGPEHENYAKRALAQDIVDVMAELGIARFAVAGHDRGGRVAYRAALDHPENVTHLVVLDVLPVEDVWTRADARMAMGFWPWSLLAQPAPLPERLLGADPAAVIDHALGAEWGTPATTFPDEVRQAYLAALSDPASLHAICEEYRAAATIDREHDRADQAAGRRIGCPVLALWSADGPLGTWYQEDGGPLAIWRRWAADVRGDGVAGGHFFPEEFPAETARRIGEFVGRRDATR